MKDIKNITVNYDNNESKPFQQIKKSNAQRG